MPFKKGQSGNTKGRPICNFDLRIAARAEAENAVETLKTIMNSSETPHNARVTAAKELLDRGYGKPAQVHSGDAENPIVHQHALAPNDKAILDQYLNQRKEVK